jgi:hypothetical protein
MSILDRLFGRGGRKDDASTSDANAIYYFVRCDKCGEAIRIRLGRQSDLAQEFEGEGDYPTGHSVSKDVMGRKCFKMMHLEVRYDKGYRETSRELTGGTFITRQEYEQAQGS